jgi:hypothetical protein
MTLLTRYSRLADHTRSSSCRESKATLRKTASRNSCRHFSSIYQSYQKLWPFRSVSEVLPTRPSRHRVAIPQQPQWKQPPKTLVKIWAWSNRRIKIYGSFETLHKSRRPDLISPSSDSKATIRKTASGNSCKNLNAIQRLDKTLWPFWHVTQGWPTRPPRHLVGNPKQH